PGGGRDPLDSVAHSTVRWLPPRPCHAPSWATLRHPRRPRRTIARAPRLSTRYEPTGALAAPVLDPGLPPLPCAHGLDAPAGEFLHRSRVSPPDGRRVRRSSGGRAPPHPGMAAVCDGVGCPSLSALSHRGPAAICH